MKLHIVYEGVLLAAAAQIFVEFAPPMSAYFMVGIAMLILGVEILDKLGIIARVSHFLGDLK
jgi:hypothetical protein